MQIDATTIQDLGIFSQSEENSVFEFFNHTRTVSGKHRLYQNLSTPLNTIEAIEGISSTIRLFEQEQLSETISNGTIMVVEQFMEARVDTIPYKASFLNALTYKIFNNHDYRLAKYAVEHYRTFFKGLLEITTLFQGPDLPKPLAQIIQQINSILQNPDIQSFLEKDLNKNPGLSETLSLAHTIRYRIKRKISELVAAYAQIDAWSTIARIALLNKFVYPQWTSSDTPEITTENLYHLILKNPVPYTFSLHQKKNFMFLTSANMAGKSTFIKTVGIAVYLAHCGFPIPAQSMKLTPMDGLLTNINITDNLSRGESYFYNEVKRVSETVTKINNGKKWLVLIDELFKGTNVQDAMKCSITVIEGLLKIQSSLFILSTHLYEIADTLKKYENISFRYFETDIKNDIPIFNYTLREGVSNDRLGYLILKHLGVVKKLNDL
jgi:DNA mismatch repair ATPase MutS